MVCNQCGYTMPEGMEFCVQCGCQMNAPDPWPALSSEAEGEKLRKNRTPSAPVRVLLRIASSILSLCLIGTLIATALVVDMQRLMSQKQMEKVVDSVLQERPSSSVLTLARNALENGTEQLSRDQLAAWICDTLKIGDDQMNITPEQLGQFLEESTADEFLIEKMTGFASDFVNGTKDTTLQKAEVLEVLEENTAAIEEVFGVKVDAELKQKVTDYIEQKDIENVIHNEVFAKIEAAQLMEDYTVGSLLEDVRRGVSVQMLIWLVLFDLLLIGLLFLTNWFRLGATLRCAGVSMATAGGMLSVPVLVLQFVPALLEGLGGGVVIGLTQTLVAVVAPVHYTIFGLGVAAFIAGVVVSILNRSAKN